MQQRSDSRNNQNDCRHHHVIQEKRENTAGPGLPEDPLYIISLLHTGPVSQLISEP